MLSGPIPPTTGIVLGIVFVATMVRAVFGFGAALVAMPLLSMTVGVRTAAPLVAMIGSAASIAVLCQHWRSVDLKSAWRLLLTTFMGIPIGLLFLREAYESSVKIVLAILIVVFALYNLFKPKLRALAGERLAYPFGLVAGILGGAYNTSGPIVVIYATLKKWPAKSFRATLQWYFLLSGLFVLVGHGMAGMWTSNVLQFGLFSMPIVVLGTLSGNRLSQAIPQGKFNRYVYVMLIALGVMLFINSL